MLCIACNPGLRKGYAIFKRNGPADQAVPVPHAADPYVAISLP
jgi:hypothetical protein